MNATREQDRLHDLVLPTLLFAALGGMTWAVRGCSGYGAANGCVFAGVTWGTAWWFIARRPGAEQWRPFSSGWIIFALTLGIGFSGSRGWMQWPSFFQGFLQVNSAKGETVPIDRLWGFVWLFIAGVPWAGLGACLLAWCNAETPTRARDWALRIAFAIGGGVLSVFVYHHHREYFLPLYSILHAQFDDAWANPKTTAYPNLRRLIGDNQLALQHLGIYLGLLSCEAIFRRWRNVVLIVTVGLLNGIGWSLLQNWKWAPSVWPGSTFNFWRCWESSGGISIGIAYGVAYYLTNRKMAQPVGNPNPTRERFGLWLGLLLGMTISIRCGLKGWANIYLGNEDHWDKVLWRFMTPLQLAGLLTLIAWSILRPLSKDYAGDLFPRAAWIVWGVLIVQNILAQLVTGPMGSGSETAFKIYYVVLFFISGAIVLHYQKLKTHEQEAAA